MRPVDENAFLRPAPGTAAGASTLDTSTGTATGAGRLDTGRRSSTPRPGWYAYRVTGPAELPSWAVEIAFTIERPAASTVQAPDGGPTDGEPVPTEAGALPAYVRRVEQPVGPGSREPWVPPPQSWVDEPLDPLAPEPELPTRGGPVQAMVLLRAPGRLPWLDGIAEVIAEVETVAGIRRTDPEHDLVEGTGGGRGRRLPMGPVLPGLTPVRAAVAREHLRIAGARGLPAPLRRRRPAAGESAVAWRAGAGCVLTCDGPDGRSAQAVIGLRGTGNPAAIAPPPGGAVILRSWRARAGFGVACGLVLGAPATLGLGREARRVAAAARNEGWDASVLSGSAAVLLARAGCPRRPVPREVALAATRTQVAALFESCLIAAGSAGDRQRRQLVTALQPGDDPLPTP